MTTPAIGLLIGMVGNMASAHTVLVGPKSMVTMVPGSALVEMMAPIIGIFEDIVAERMRQVERGYDAGHDDEHKAGELAQGAAAYALASMADPPIEGPDIWPFEKQYWNSESRSREDLIKAAAMLLAEIERIDRRDTAAACVDTKAAEAEEEVPF